MLRGDSITVGVRTYALTQLNGNRGLPVLRKLPKLLGGSVGELIGAFIRGRTGEGVDLDAIATSLDWPRVLKELGERLADDSSEEILRILLSSLMINSPAENIATRAFNWDLDLPDHYADLGPIITMAAKLNFGDVFRGPLGQVMSAAKGAGRAPSQNPSTSHGSAQG